MRDAAFDDYLPSCSGAPGTALDRAQLDFEGRRYLGSTTTGLANDPIRVYAGAAHGNSAERARTATEELVRLGAGMRGTIVIGAPTGRGWVNHVLLRALEILTGGDVASVASQFGTERSMSSGRAIAEAVASTRALLDAIQDEPRLRDARLLVVGESFGAWTLARLLDRLVEQPPTALALVGTPGAAGIDRRLDRLEVLVDLGTTVVRHERRDDPVVAFPGARLAWRPVERWRAVDGRTWLPIVTARRAMREIDRVTRFDDPTEVPASAHDYRAQLPAVAARVLGIDEPDEVRRVARELVRLEREQSTWKRTYGPAPRQAWAGTGV